jgi:hypothetical protein
MKFSLLLFVLGIKLRITAFMSDTFRKKLRKKDFTLVIRTNSGKRARTFTFFGGKVRSRRGCNGPADTELVWCDEQTAVTVMLSKNELDGFSAIGRSALSVTGNFENALWFMEIAE